MSTPNPPDRGEPERPAADPAAPAPFDPYRFGLPDTPPPPEYAPPGYVFPTAPPPAPAAPPQEPPAPRPAAAGPWASPGPPVQPPTYPGYPQYGAPAPPLQHDYVQPRPGSGKCVAALVLGIVSILLFWTTVFDAVPAILAIVFGTIGLSEARNRGGGGRGMALAGIICAAVGAIAAIAFTAFILHAANQCGGLSHQNDPGFKQCVQNKF
jgi:hypothetical protein